MSDAALFHYQKYDPKKQTYVYIVGPIPPEKGYAGGGHKALGLSDRDANNTEELEALAIAVLREDPEVFDGDQIEAGAQMRILRVPTRLYNSFVDKARDATVLEVPMARGTIKARYVLKVGPGYVPGHPGGGWYFSEWLDRDGEFNLGGHGDPGVPRRPCPCSARARPDSSTASTAPAARTSVAPPTGRKPTKEDIAHPWWPPRHVDPKERPHVYSAGPIPAREDDPAQAGGQRVMAFYTDAMADDRTTLVQTAIAILRPRGQPSNYDPAQVPPGAQIRVLRMRTPYYNRVIAPTLFNEALPLRHPPPPPGTVTVRYVLRLAGSDDERDGWYVSTWEDAALRAGRFSMGGWGDPGCPAPTTDFLDGQHRTGSP